MPDPSAWPDRCEVLVVGAGPAGSACAQLLARAGIDTVLIDAQAFPRDKVCGDGLIPDAHAALHKLGVYDEVMARAQRARHVGCVGPRGGRVDVPGRLAVLPRRELDDIVCRAAVRAGARLLAPARFEAPLLDGERVVGARLRGAGVASRTATAGQEPAVHEIRARQVVLATGAVPQALIAAGVCERRVPSGVALRGYVRNPALAERITALEVVWHKRLRQGYGWIFPCRDGVFNIGVGLAHSHSRLADDGRQTMRDVNLREMFAAFCTVYAPARELTRGGEFVGELKGAPLRCSLDGAQLTRAGLMVTGEAAGSTYAFTGEGIGKAMETGMLAARALIDAHLAASRAAAPPAAARDAAPHAASDAALDAAHRPYRQAIAALKPRFDLYERANRVNNHPWLADLLIWRANRSPRILQRMAGVLEETGNPGNLVSVRGIARLLLPLR